MHNLHAELSEIILIISDHAQRAVKMKKRGMTYFAHCCASLWTQCSPSFALSSQCNLSHTGPTHNLTYWTFTSSGSLLLVLQPFFLVTAGGQGLFSFWKTLCTSLLWWSWYCPVLRFNQSPQTPCHAMFISLKMNPHVLMHPMWAYMFSIFQMRKTEACQLAKGQKNWAEESVWIQVCLVSKRLQNVRRWLELREEEGTIERWGKLWGKLCKEGEHRLGCDSQTLEQVQRRTHWAGGQRKVWPRGHSHCWSQWTERQAAFLSCIELHPLHGLPCPSILLTCTDQRGGGCSAQGLSTPGKALGLTFSATFNSSH